MLTRASARTASRSELRDRPSWAARSASRGSRSPARSAPVVIMALIFSMASSVTATADPPMPLLLRRSAHRYAGWPRIDPMFAPEYGITGRRPGYVSTAWYQWGMADAAAAASGAHAGSPDAHADSPERTEAERYLRA